jgi:tetratricopeptide (TPR) repeat protein
MARLTLWRYGRWRPLLVRSMPYKFNDSRRPKIPKAKYRVANWPKYDAALVKRGSLTVWMTEEAIAAWQAPATGKRGGQPIYSAIAIETSLALRLVFHHAALAWYAYWHAFVIGQGWADDITDVIQNANKFAERAIQLDPRDARALTIAGHIRAFLHGEPQQAAALHDTALLTNPHFAMSWALSAITYAYIGKTAEAENRFNRYKRLSPLDPFAFFFDGFVMLIHLQKHDHEAAIASGRAIIQQAPLLSAALKPYLSALGHPGRPPEAETIRHRLMLVEPGFSVERFLLNSK